MSQIAEWFFITPCGRHIVTRYWEASETDAWRREGMRVAYPGDRPAYIDALKRQGFTMSLIPPPPQPPPQIMVTDGLHLLDGR